MKFLINLRPSGLPSVSEAVLVVDSNKVLAKVLVFTSEVTVEARRVFPNVLPSWGLGAWCVERIRDKYGSDLNIHIEDINIIPLATHIPI